MIRLPYTGTYSLELITAQNGAQVVVFYSDDSSSAYPGGVQATTISSATTTKICDTPVAANVREIDHINIKNTYAGSHTITVQLDANGTNYPLQTVALLENESYNYTHGSGWQCKDANGNTKASALTAMTSAQLRGIVTDETGDALLYFQNGALGTPASGDTSNCTTNTEAANNNSTQHASTAYADRLTAGTLPGAFTTLSATDSIIITKATGPVKVQLIATTGTNELYTQYTNTGGSYYSGVENSASTWFGATPYAMTRYAPTGRVIQDIIAGIGPITTISSTGLAVTGAISLTTNLTLPKTVTAAGTTGAQTINKISGTVNFAAAAASLIVTNSFVDANSIIQCTIGTNDATMKSVQAVAAAGSFTIYPNAVPTAETRVNFRITN